MQILSGYERKSSGAIQKNVVFAFDGKIEDVVSSTKDMACRALNKW